MNSTQFYDNVSNYDYNYYIIYRNNIIYPTLILYKIEKSNSIRYMAIINSADAGMYDIEELFKGNQLELVLQYFNAGKVQPYIINLLFSYNKIEKELAINLLKTFL